MKLLVLITLLFGVGFWSNAAMAQDCFSYEPSSVTLRGRIVRKTFAGRPNYESIKKGDEAETYWILQLSRPICVSGDETEKNVSEIQLVFSDGSQYKQYKNLLGKRVVASGNLFPAHTGHHHTDVLLTVAGIKGVRRQ